MIFLEKSVFSIIPSWPSGRGIRVTGGSTSATQKVIGNAVFASTPIQAADKTDNITDAYSAASIYLDNPFASLGQFSLYPKVGELIASLMDTTEIQPFTEWNVDFNGVVHTGHFRGAYAGEGVNPGWLPNLERRPFLNTTDTTPPARTHQLDPFINDQTAQGLVIPTVVSVQSQALGYGGTHDLNPVFYRSLPPITAKNHLVVS